MEYRGQWRSPCSFHGQLLPVNEHLHLLVPTQTREIPGGNNKKEKKGHCNLLEFKGSVREGTNCISSAHCTELREKQDTMRQVSLLFPTPEVKFSPVMQPNPLSHCKIFLPVPILLLSLVAAVFSYL